MVTYEQSAKSNLAQPPKQDDRARYARYRKKEESIRVLSSPGESRFTGRARTASGFAGEDFSDSAYQVQQRWLKDQRGVTVREHRIKQSQANKPRSRIPFRIFIAVLVVAVLLGAAVATYFSPAFSIETVEISGIDRLSTEYVSTLAGDVSDTTLLRVDVEGIQTKLLADPWIARVEVTRSFPSTLVVTVTERNVAATVEIVSMNQATVVTKHWLLSSDGLWLGEVDLSLLSSGTEAAAAGVQGASQTAHPAAETSLLSNVKITTSQLKQVPRIRDVSASMSPTLGLSVNDEGITNTLAIINGLSAEMLAQVRFISAPDRVKTTLTLSNNVEVAFGAAEDVAAKEKVILALLKEHEGRIVYINVRVVDRVTYRSA